MLMMLLLGPLFGCSDSVSTATDGDSISQSIQSPDQAAAQLRALYFSQEWNTASEESLQLLARFPDAPNAAAWSVLNVARAGEHEKATSEADRLLQEYPHSAWAQFALGGALLFGRRASDDEVHRATAGALSADADNPDFLWLEAEALRSWGRNADVIALLEQNDSLVALSPELLNTKASALLQMARENRADATAQTAAIRIYARVREMEPTNVNAHYQPGLYLLTLGRPSEAYALLKRAATLSTASRVQSAYWSSVSHRSDLSLAEKREEVDSSINRLLSQEKPGADVLWAASLAYREVQLPDRQSRLEDRLLAEHPRVPLAEEVLMSRIFAMQQHNGEEAQAAVRNALRQFLRSKPHHSQRLVDQAQRMLFASIKDDRSVGTGELLELLRAMSSGPGIARIVAQTEGAVALADRGVHLREAEEIVLQGLATLRTVPVEPLRSPAHPKSQQGVAHPLEAALRDALGWVYFKIGRFPEAERELLTSYTINAQRSSTLLHLAELYDTRGDFARAELYLIRCGALASAHDSRCSALLRDRFMRRHGNTQNLDAYLSKVEARLDRERDLRIAATRIPDRPLAPLFALRSLDGETISLGDLRGRLVIVKFWGSWCEACRSEMSAFAKLVDRYARATDVAIVSISNDSNPDVVRRWMLDNGYSFTVLVDDGYFSRAAIRGVPTAWFLDERGARVFEIAGATDNLEDEYGARIAMMRTIKNQRMDAAISR